MLSRIYLNTSASGVRCCQKLRTVLLHSPHLIGYTESIHLQLGSPLGSYYYPNSQINVLSDMLTTFKSPGSCVRSFQLSGPVPWMSLPAIHQDAICNFLSSPCLVSASIVGIPGFPLGTLAHCSQLTEISINDLNIHVNLSDPTIQNYPVVQFAPPKHKGHLTALSGGEGESGAVATRVLVHCLVHPNSSLSLSALRNFTAAVRSNEDVTAYQKVLLLSQRSLKSLTLSADCKGGTVRFFNVLSWLDSLAPTELSFIEIGPLSNLRHLSITIFKNPFLSIWLLRLLKSVPEINKIRELNITVIFSDFVEATWGEIDYTLSQPTFSLLEVISLRYWRREDEALLPEQRFPLLVTKDIFCVFNEGDRVKREVLSNPSRKTCKWDFFDDVRYVLIRSHSEYLDFISWQQIIYCHFHVLTAAIVHIFTQTQNCNLLSFVIQHSLGYVPKVPKSL